MQQHDSLTFEPNHSVAHDSVVPKPKVVKPKTVSEVLKTLPANATPEQQDSAVQANFKPGKRIYNNQPDTIGLQPGTRDPNPLGWKQISTYRNPYLFTDTTFYTSEDGDIFGVSADPVPYTIANDDIITALLVGSLLLTLIALRKTQRIITLKLKTFFDANNSNRLANSLSEMSNEIRNQLFLCGVTCLLLSTFYFLYTLENVADTFILSSQYELLIIYFSVFAGYFLLRLLIYSGINWVFFEPTQRLLWNRSQLFLTAILGVLLLPFVLSITYFGMSIDTGLVYIVGIVILFELLTFIRCYIIFFNRNGGIFQIFVYFCALEIVPLAALLGVLIELNNLLKISY